MHFHRTLCASSDFIDHARQTVHPESLRADAGSLTAFVVRVLVLMNVFWGIDFAAHAQQSEAPDRLMQLESDMNGPVVQHHQSDPLGLPARVPKTLSEFVEIAERNHPRMRSARANVEGARGKAVQARLYPNPVLASASPQISGNESQWNGFVTQDIVTGGKLRLAQQAALREVQVSQYELIRARFDVLTGVRRDFYGLLVSQRRLEIFQLLLEISTKSYDIGRRLAEAGEGSKADGLFWSIERDRAEVRLLNASVFIETGRRQLAASIAVPGADIGMVDGDLFQHLPTFDLKSLQESILQNNSKPRAAESNIARAQWAMERSVVEPIPNINLLGGYQRQVGPTVQDQGLMQVMMSVPLFDRNQGNIRSARAEIASSRADLRQVELDLATVTAQTVAAYRTSQRLVDWYEDYILPKARETVTVTQTLYSRGETSFLNLLQAQRLLTETELAYVEAQAERWNGSVTLADLLQLETFPPAGNIPAVIDNDRVDQLDMQPRRDGFQAPPADAIKPLPAP